MKKLLILLLALVMVLPSFAACSNNNDHGKTDDTTAPDITEETTKPEPLRIVSGGKSDFTIVYPEDPGKDLFGAIRSFHDAIEKETGADLKYKTDFIKPNENHDDNAFEILIGNTNYTQTAKVMKTLKTCDYAIVRSGNKIVIAGYNDRMISRALSYFRKNLIKNNLETDASGKKTLYFQEYIYTTEAPINSIKVDDKELKDFKIVYAKKERGFYRPAKAIAEAISGRYGYMLEIVSDTSCEPTEKEILVGPTNRPESATFAAKHETPNLTYHIGVENGKLIICGQPYSCLQAASGFSAHFLHNSEKNVVITENDTYTKSNISQKPVPLTDGADIRIMTSNILAEFTSWSNTYEITPVQERVEILAALMETYSPDVVGLQEVTDQWDAMIPKYLGDKYEFIHMLTPDHKLVNYSTMIYDKTKYDVLDSGVMYFTTEGVNHIRLVTWAVFSSKLDSNVKFSVFNTHWCWDTPEHAHQQAYEESKLIERVTKDYPYPYFCTADYNTKEFTPNYNYFVELTGAEDAKYVAKDAGTLINVAGGCANLGESRPSGGHSIDHIFMSPGPKVLRFETVLSNCIIDLSDHSPKYADIKLN